MLPNSYGQALNNAGYAQSMYAQPMNSGSGFDPSAQYAASAGHAASNQSAYNANQQRLAAQAAWQTQQQAAAPNTYANRVELEKELAYNENEIKALQNELETMRAQWGDLDSMDRQLAANRARIGDFGNARAHQNDIIARQNDRNRVADTAMQWRWQANQNRISREADQRKQAKADIKRIIGEIEDIDVQIPYQTEVGAVNALNAKKARLVRELAGYGVAFENEVPNTVQTNVSDAGANNVSQLVQNEAAATNKNGLFNSPDEREKIAKSYDELGLKAEAKRVRNTRTVGEAKKAKEDREKEEQEADSIAKKYMNLTEAQLLDFKTKWNEGKDKEIKKLQKFYTLDYKTGGLKKKGK